jgi:hypothetical protein
MRFAQVVDHTLNSYLYEGLTLNESRSVRLWENAGRKILEAELTVDQIQQLFKSVEQGATSAGNNRTTIGQGKDVATAVNKAWEDLKTKVQNSGPIKNIDAQYDQAAEKLKQATGGDQGVMQYVEKYRKFAKEHPIAQSLIYSALIAAAGISGIGAGGAAALGLLKMTDKLLQGEKFSTALGKGLSTGALAYGAGQVGKALQGGDQAQQAAQQAGSGFGRLSADAFQNDPYWGPKLQQVMSDPKITDAYKNEFMKALSQSVGNAADTKSLSQAWISAGQVANGLAGNPYGPLESIQYSKKLSVLEVRAVIGSVALQEAGVWDTVKGAAGKVAGAVVNKAQTVGHNLTTKVTADKLQSAWKKAGSPTDSEAVRQVLQSTGVSDDVINQTFQQLNISNEPAQQTDQSITQQNSNKLTLKQINAIIPTLRLRDLLSLQKTVDATLNKGAV